MILVTGATGFVGRSLMRALQQQELPVRTYKGLMNDGMRLREALDGVQIVYHLASAETSGSRRRLQHVDIDGTERLVRESQRAEVQRIIMMSRLNASPNSIYPLLKAKGEAERLVRQSTIPHTVVRSATLFGIDDRFLNVIASLAAWTWPFVWLPNGGEVAMQPLWVEDLVECLVLLLERPDLCGETVTVAGEERMRYRQLVQLVLEAAGFSRVPLKVDVRLLRPLRAMTMGWWRPPPVTSFFLHRFSVPDVAPADSVLHTFDFRPERLVDHLAYLRRGGWRRRLFRL
ncbi:MAG TPA: NAD(P)H-binding protein [Candidatus Sulfomarinibacteraceae bacterium]|nr:NAD(P)H-binding protein [Candidatus Sulfomarinibacteraceae bacterium]